MMIHTSTFQDLKAGKIDAMDVSPEQLLSWFQNPMRAASKQSLRLLSLRRFGDLRSERGSLRHDANVVSVTGLTGDYDAGKVSIDDAVGLLKRESVRAMLFTSPSSTEAAPRWRVVAPVSAECGPDEHLELMGRLNAVLGGVLASESFTLSQAYFYGKADDAAHYETRDTLHMNRWIDHVDIEPVFPAARVSAPVVAHAAVAPDARLRTGEGRREALKSYIASVSARGLGKVEIDALVRVYVEQHFDASDPVDWSNVTGMVEWAAARDAVGRVDISSVRIERSAGEARPVPMRAIPAHEFVSAIPTPEYMLDGVFQRGFVYSLTGPTGAGKTAVALALAACTALGRDFAGHETSPCTVLYVASENPDDVRARLQAWCAHSGVAIEELGDRLYFVDESFTLEDREADLHATIESVGAALVILDTDQALAGSEDENNNSERIAHAKRVRALCRATSRPCVVDLCHPAAAATRASLRPRGGSAFLAEIDGNAGLWREDGTDLVEVFKTAKFRGPEFEPLVFELRTVAIDALRDSKGRPMLSVVAVPATEADDDRMFKEGRKQMLAALSSVSREPEMSQRNRADSLGMSRTALQRALNDLVAKGAIAKTMTGFEMKPSGKRWLASTPKC